MCLNTKYQERLTLAYSVFSPPDQRQSTWARTLGYYAQCCALGASLRGARSQQRQQLVLACARSTVIPGFFVSRKTVFHFASFTAENAIGSKSEAQNLNRIRNSLTLGLAIRPQNWVSPYANKTRGSGQAAVFSRMGDFFSQEKRFILPSLPARPPARPPARRALCSLLSRCVWLSGSPTNRRTT